MTRTKRQHRQAFVIAGMAAFGLATFPAACVPSDAAEAGDAGSHDEQPRLPTVPRGTALTFRVDAEVSTTTHRKGDVFTATLTGSAMGVEGESAIPSGSTGIWRVVEASAEGSGGQSVLGVGLESVEVRGTRYPVSATVVSTAIEADEPDSGRETAVKIGIGAAAGAVAGRLLGDDAADALKGAGVGAAFGTVVALSTRGGSARLPAGSRLVVRLEQTLTLDGNGH